MSLLDQLSPEIQAMLSRGGGAQLPSDPGSIAPQMQMAPGADLNVPLNTITKPKQGAPNEAFLALAAGLLGGRNFQDGLSRGLTAYQSSLQAVRDRAKPQSSAIENGAFDRSVDEQGNVSYKANPDVQKYQTNQAETMFGRKLDFQNVKDGNFLERQRQHDAIIQDIANDRIKAESGDKAAQMRMEYNIARLRDDTTLQAAHITADGRQNRPTPPAATAAYTTAKQNKAALQNSASQLDRVEGYIRGGQLNLGLITNLRHKAAMAGLPFVGDKETPLFGEFQQTIEGLRNAILQNNKGTQTEGDAVRALNAIIAGQGDEQTVLSGIALTRQALASQSGALDNTISTYESQYGFDGAGGGSGGNPHLSPAPSAPARQGWSIKRVK